MTPGERQKKLMMILDEIDKGLAVSNYDARLLVQEIARLRGGLSNQCLHTYKPVGTDIVLRHCTRCGRDNPDY